MNAALQAYVDEYNQLRAEIRLYLEHSAKNLQIAVVLGTAAVSFGSLYPPALVPASMIVLYLWYDEVRHLQAVQRTASYLEVFVEPAVPGLEGESTNRDHPFEGSVLNRALAELPFPTLVVGQALYAMDQLAWTLRPVAIGIAVISCALGLGVLSYRVARSGRDKERDRWRAIRDWRMRYLDKVRKLAVLDADSVRGLELDTYERSRVLAELETVRAQLASPTPKANTVRECLYSIRLVLQRGAGPRVQAMAAEINSLNALSRSGAL